MTRIRNIITEVLVEHRATYDTIGVLKNYSGNDPKLNRFKQILNSGGSLTVKSLEMAVDLLKKEYYANTIYNQIKDSKELVKKIISGGTETYNNLIRSSKRNFFRTQGDTSMKVSQPSDKWIEENKKSLEDFLIYTKNSPKKFWFPKRDVQMTTHEEARKLLKQLETKDFWGFMEKIGNDYEWSLLNKLDSNYTNWAKMIAKRDLQKQLGDGSLNDKIDTYFRQQPIEELYADEMYDFDIEQKRMIWATASKLSIAELDIIEAFLSHNSDEPESRAIDHLDNIMDRLKKTTIAGDKAENDFVMWLGSNKVPASDIIRFNTYGNLVDVTFQIDLIAKINGKWIPIQVKNKRKYTKLFSYDIGGILVYPAPSRYNCGNWIYDTGRSLERSFSQDFFGVPC